MKKVMVCLLAQLAVMSSAMEPPAPVMASTPQRAIEQAGILKVFHGPDAELHKKSSFIWAYVDASMLIFPRRGYSFLIISEHISL